MKQNTSMNHKNAIKVLLMIVCVCIVGHGYAQTMQYKAVQFVCTKYNNYVFDPPEIKDCGKFPILFDMDSSILSIQSPKPQRFILDAKPLSFSEDDSTIYTLFNAVDEKGKKCKITAYLYKRESDKYAAQFWMEYPDKKYMYYVDNK